MFEIIRLRAEWGLLRVVENMFGDLQLISFCKKIFQIGSLPVIVKDIGVPVRLIEASPIYGS